jgi:hypothetical protein
MLMKVFDGNVIGSTEARTSDLCEACEETPASHQVTYLIVETGVEITLKTCLQCLADAQSQALMGEPVTAIGFNVKYISHEKL